MAQPFIYNAENHPDLSALKETILTAGNVIADRVTNGGLVLAAGNGGSCADALHFSGELLKSFLLPRPLNQAMVQALSSYAFGGELADSLERGVPVVVLGQNSALSSAYLNDGGHPHSVLAQECLALCRPGDVLVAFSTSGESENLIRAMAVAKAKGASTIAFTGKGGGRMGAAADIEVRSPAPDTPTVQEHHVILYHALCALVEKTLFEE